MNIGSTKCTKICLYWHTVNCILTLSSFLKIETSLCLFWNKRKSLPLIFHPFSGFEAPVDLVHILELLEDLLQSLVCFWVSSNVTNTQHHNIIRLSLTRKLSSHLPGLWPLGPLRYCKLHYFHSISHQLQPGIIIRKFKGCTWTLIKIVLSKCKKINKIRKLRRYTVCKFLSLHFLISS